MVELHKQCTFREDQRRKLFLTVPDAGKSQARF